MGADLLLSGLVHSKKKKLDWRKGREVARKLSLEEVRKGLEETTGDGYSLSARECRANLNGIISALKEEITSADARDAYTWELGGKVLHIRGGTSWGDDPSDGWTIFTDAYQFPTVLKAIGFDVPKG